jgi:hypothetical protein
MNGLRSALFALAITSQAVVQTAQAPDSTRLPGKGLAQHPFLYCGEWQDRGKSEQVMKLVRDGTVVWTYSIPGKEEYGDCTRLSFGPASSTQLLDEPGVPENGDLQR